MSISEHEAKVLADFDAYETELAAHRARVAELERELEGMRQRAHAAEAQRDEAVSLAHESLTESVRAKAERDEARLRVCTTAIGCGECERCRAVADAARLREALEVTVQQGDIVGAYSENEVFMLRHYMRVAWLAAKAALASAPSAEPEGPDYSGLCSAPECGGHCGFAHAVGCEAIREYLAEHGGDAYKAPARTAHLAPSAEPTPRVAYMRVAKAVRGQIARHIRMSPSFGGQLTTPNDDGLLGRVAQEIENLELAPVVAKALEVGT